MQENNAVANTLILVEGLTEKDTVIRIGKAFGIHPLVVEDILNTHQRPKFEEYDDYLFIVLKCLVAQEDGFDISYEQISLLVLDKFVLVFKEKQDKLLAPVKERIRMSRGRLRSMGTDYLAYVILDTVVDSHFVLLDLLDDTVESIEDDLFDEETTQDTLNRIQKIRREVITIRRYLVPTRELMFALLRSESELIHEKTHAYFRDVSDHTLRAVELIESYREILAGLVDIYISSVNNKMNEVVKVLTVFSSIFIPLTFIAGIYGTNFDYLPELRYKYSYFIFWGVLIVIAGGLLGYFKRKKWF